jgi:hypothetical protein
LAIIALVGLALVVADFVRERVTDHRAARRTEQGLPPVVWSWRKRATVIGGPLIVLVMVGLVAGLAQSSEDTTSGDTDVNVIPTTTTSTGGVPTTRGPGRPNGQIRVQVVNGSGQAGAATAESDALRILGYVMVPPGTVATRRGTAIQCKPGFEGEATTLARNVGGIVAVESIPGSSPYATAALDCVVILGR